MKANATVEKTGWSYRGVLDVLCSTIEHNGALQLPHYIQTSPQVFWIGFPLQYISTLSFSHK